MIIYPDVTQAWLVLLDRILEHGRWTAPRGQLTREVDHSSVSFLMSPPLLDAPARGLSLKFAAAEALWILSGSDLVAEISPWNKKMAEYSDDGETLFGAYGPRVVDQLPYVVETLLADPVSRQAGLTLWREVPPKTKDVPCTLALWFRIVADQRLDVHAVMRSSDVWLGWPYDAFTFTMIGARVACELNHQAVGDPRVTRLGVMHFTAFSSHLYEQHLQAASTLVELSTGQEVDPSEREALDHLVKTGNWGAIEGALLVERHRNARPVWPVSP